MTKPTPEEKCCICEFEGYDPKCPKHGSPSTEARVNPLCGIHHAPCDCKTEARVDWEKEAKELMDEVREHDACCTYDCQCMTLIKNALQAAFEKGREAR